MSEHHYTHGYGAAVMAGHRRRTAENSAAHLVPHLRSGDRLLDLGSGAGIITADLARIVGHENLTAVEVAEEAAALTRGELAAQGIEGSEVVLADGSALPFADDTFDVVHAHQVLQHVADPVGVLREARRVTRPGGIIAIRDSDYGGFRWFPQSEVLDRWLACYLDAARRNGGSPDAGRRLLSWARAAGFEDITVSSSTWCYATEEEKEVWAITWSGRLRGGALADSLQRHGLMGPEAREQAARAFEQWARQPDGWFSVLHGEILARA